MVRKYWLIIPKIALVLAIFLLLLFNLSLLAIPEMILAENENAGGSGDSCLKDCRLDKKTGMVTEKLSDRCYCCGECDKCDVIKVIKGIIDGSVKVLLPIGTFAVVVSGFMYIISAGKAGSETKPGSLQTAKAALSAAIIGVIIVLTAWLLVNMITAAFGYGLGVAWYQIQC